MNTKNEQISSGLIAVAWSVLNGEHTPLVRLSDADAIISDLQNLVIAENQRKQQLEEEVERLTRSPTIEDAKTTVQHLRAYAADNGYSHGDYADVMTEAASQIEKQVAALKLASVALMRSRFYMSKAIHAVEVKPQCDKALAAIVKALKVE